ncbi:MAG: excinuclease ABC subunit UvrA [Thermodesulfobacteriota bacterium]
MAKKKTATVHKLKPRRGAFGSELIIEGLRQNNLKNLSFSIPHNSITAVVGPSGSGKSSLAFDTLFAEGRWRFMESLSTYTRLFLERMNRPELDSIRNIRPAIAIEQKNPVRSSRSTVATATEVYDYMRILFARAGRTHCPDCHEPVWEATPTRIADKLLANDQKSFFRALIGFRVNFKDNDPGTKASTIDGLLKKGFIRALYNEEIVRLEDIKEKISEGTLAELMIIADRLIIKEAERARLVEALEASLRQSENDTGDGGEAWVRVEDADNSGTELMEFSRSFMCVPCKKKLQRPTPMLFSFNHPVGACPECKGFGKTLKYSTERVVPDENLTLNEGAIEPWTKPSYRWFFDALKEGAHEAGLDLDKPFKNLSKTEREIVFKGTEAFKGIDGFFEHLERKKYKLHIRVFLSRYKNQFLCEECNGTRLKKSALSVLIGGLNISQVSAMTLKEAREFFITLELTPYEAEVSREVLKQIAGKIEFLNLTGLDYITLDRLTKTLSGGEAQRVTLANQLGSALSGVLYILDEPSIGLHPRDIDKLIDQVKGLAARGNTVVLVEHDPAVIMSAEHILELGPGAGERGGRLVYSGATNVFLKEAKTLTSKYLSKELSIPVPRWRRKGRKDFITLTGATGNNLQDVTLRIPLNTLTCVTGVSGSGKSTLIMDTLFNALSESFDERAEKPLPYKTLTWTGALDGASLIDQTPIGRTPRSNPITYLGCFDDIRRFFADLPSARASGLSQGSFSFNVPGGRCEACKGQGVEKLEMYFLPDIYIQCSSCSGKRYKPQVLDIKYKGRNIFDILEMTFDELSALIPVTPNLRKKFSIIKDVGLGYLRLGQPATTLSGGEAQRLKIARELSGTGTANMLYILDEPTTGLHMDDIKNLLSVLGRLVDTGHTVLVIEHNLDCIKCADHIIDLGPEGGGGGGEIVAEGSPEAVAKERESITGSYLKAVLKR